MFSRNSFSFSASLLVATALSTPLFAQNLSPADAWSRFQNSANDLGLTITAGAQEVVGDAMQLENVRIVTTTSPKDFIVEMPQMAVSAEGENIVLTPASEFNVTTRFGGGYLRQFTMQSEGDIVYSLDDDTANMLLSFGHLGGELTHATRRGTPLNEDISFRFEEMETRLNVEREGHLDAVLTAMTLAYSFALPEADIMSEDIVFRDVRFEFGGREFDMLDDDAGSLRSAFDAGFSAQASLRYSGQESRSSLVIEGVRLETEGRFGAGQMELVVADSMARLSGTAEGAELNGRADGIEGDVSFADVSFELGMPLVPTSTDRPFTYQARLDDLAVSESILALVNAQGFAGETATIALAMSADGRLTHDLETHSGDEPPFDLSAFRLDELELRIGDSSLTGEGAISLAGGFMNTIIRGMPQGTGDFTFELVGGNTLLGRLVEAGIVPQDQMFVARMMMNGLGQLVGEDHLRSEVTIRPGGQILVNGAPLPF